MFTQDDNIGLITVTVATILNEVVGLYVGLNPLLCWFSDVELGGSFQLTLNVPSDGSCETEITISSFDERVNFCFRGVDGVAPTCKITEIDVSGCNWDSLDFLLCLGDSKGPEEECEGEVLVVTEDLCG